MNNPIIKQLDSSEIPKWDTYVESHPDSTFYHKGGWKNVIEKSFGHKTYFLYAEIEGEIDGVLPLAYVKSTLFGNSLTSLPFCVYGGIVTSSEKSSDLLLEEATKIAKNLNVDYLELRNIEECMKDWPRKSLYVTFRKEIDSDPEKNILSIPRKQRAMVRKGIKAGLKSELDLTVDRVYQAYSESVRNLGTPVFSKKYFKILKEEFGDDCELLVVTTEQGELVSGVLSFYFRDQVLPYYGGGTAAARSLKGNDFMYWEVMRRSSEKGIRIFDYGRSKTGTGSYSFKKNWGFEPQPLNYEYKLIKAKEMPEINPLNPKYQLFIYAWKKLPLSVSGVIGPILAKSLG